MGDYFKKKYLFLPIANKKHNTKTFNINFNEHLMVFFIDSNTILDII